MINLATSVVLVCSMLFASFLLVFFMPNRAKKLGLSKISFGQNSIEIDREGIEHEEIAKDRSGAVAGSDEQSTGKTGIELDEEPAPIFQMLEAIDEHDLEKYKSAFEQHITTIPESDRDFWTSFHFVERKSIGDVEANELLVRLGEEKPEWVWPVILLAREAKNSGDYELAIKLFDQAIGRAKTDQHYHAFSERVHLEYEIIGEKSAIDLALKLLAQTQIDLAKAYLAKELGQMYTTTGDNTSAVFFYNLAAYQANENFDLKFDAAFAISGIDPDSISALHHYFQLRSKRPSQSYSVNNLAVWFSRQRNDKLYAHLLKEGAQYTPELSFSNLATFLIEQGLLDEAEAYLDEVSEPVRDKENYYRAKSNLERAKIEIQEELSKYRRMGDQGNTHYTETWESTLEYYNTGKKFLPTGDWISADGSSKVSIQSTEGSTMPSITVLSISIHSQLLFNQSAKFTGKLSNSTGQLFGNVIREKKSQPTSLTDYMDYSHSIVVNPSGSGKLRILATNDSKDRVNSLEFVKSG